MHISIIQKISLVPLYSSCPPYPWPLAITDLISVPINLPLQDCLSKKQPSSV